MQLVLMRILDFRSEVEIMWLVFVQDDPFKTINYHHLDISGHDGMDEQDVGWRNEAGADEDFDLEVEKSLLVFIQAPTLLGLSMIKTVQMILPKPSIIIIWTYPDIMEWMSRMLVGEMQLVLMRILTQKLRNCGWFLFKPQPYLDSA
jgi:hypothetical protein